MKKRIVLLASFCLIFFETLAADEKSDAEALIVEAEAMVKKLNSLGPWVGPALVMKMEAERHLMLAKETFDAEKYTEAKNHAEMSLKYAEKALGLRAWSLLWRTLLGF
ncbi:MAG: hypothetical protein ACE5K0_10185 [Candidatus Methanofastidiosia archaeon]